MLFFKVMSPITFLDSQNTNRVLHRYKYVDIVTFVQTVKNYKLHVFKK